MQLRTGLQALIGVSALGIVLAIFLIFTCPFAGRIAFSALVRQVPMAHPGSEGEHAQPPSAERHTPHGDMPPHTAQSPHEASQKAHEAGTEQHGEHTGFSVHLMVVPGVQAYPVQETNIVGVDVSVLGIIVLLLLIALCWQLLRQRPMQLWRYTVTPKTMGITVLLITLWNLVFAGFLFGVEALQFKELCLT
jgi:hypothetical protein